MMQRFSANSILTWLGRFNAGNCAKTAKAPRSPRNQRIGPSFARRPNLSPILLGDLGFLAILALKRILRSFSFIALISPFICLAGGCGYSTIGSEPVGGYQWHSLYPEDVKTIAVPIFTNKSFRRNEEFQLTKALITQIEAKTQYKVVPRERADTILEGEITSINVRRVSDNVLTAVPQENLYVVVVDFSWKDQRTGRIRVQRQNFEQDTTFYPTLGEGEFVGSQQAAEKLASGIVEQLQADW
jgi:hypothetical protein